MSKLAGGLLVCAAAAKAASLPTVGFPPMSSDDYFSQRAALVAQESALRFSAGLALSDAEIAANETWTSMRVNLTQSYELDGSFPPARYFAEIQSEIEGTDVFKVLQTMPKGGALHLHSTSGISSPSFMAHYLSTNPEGYYILWEPTCDPWYSGYPDSCPYKNSWGEALIHGTIDYLMEGWSPDEGYSSISDVMANVTDFESQLTDLLHMDERSNPENSLNAWTDFLNVMDRYENAFDEAHFFYETYMDTFRTMAEDGVQYVEMRTSLYPPRYNISSETGYAECSDGASPCALEQFLQMRDDIRAEGYPDFDVKLILAGHRSHSNDDNLETAASAIELHLAYPEVLVGYDLVGPEDEWGYDPSNPTTLKAADMFLTAIDWAQGNDTTLDLFLHDGESTWADNDNVWDAYLLGSKRIGHGINLFKYPLLRDLMAQSQSAALEVCPISNQMLQYVRDLRMHPALEYMKAGIPIVISSDDPTMFNVDPRLTDDFWEAAVAWELDIRDLKQIAMNSITYSAMTDDAKASALEGWGAAWDEWVQTLA